MTSLTDKLQKKMVHGQSRVQFVAELDSIKSAVEQGFPRKAIWEQLKEDNAIDCNYRQFLKYCVRYVDEDKAPKSNPPTQEKINEDKALKEAASAASLPTVVSAHSTVDSKGKTTKKESKIGASANGKTIRPENQKDVDNDELF